MSGIGLAGGVAEKRSRADGGILVRDRRKQRSGANGGVQIASRVAPERKPTNGRIVNAGGETQKGLLPFRGVAAGVSTVGGRADRGAVGRSQK